MMEIDDWDDWFNVWDITDISLSEIKKSKNIDEAMSWIQQEIWDKISKEDIIYITELVSKIKEYYEINSLHNDIETIWDLFDLSESKSKGFFDYIKSNIIQLNERNAQLSEDQKTNDKLLWDLLNQWDLVEELSVEETLAKELWSIGEWNLSEGLKFWDKIIKYNPDNWELLVWDINYQLYYWDDKDNNFSEITLDKGMVNFQVSLMDNRVNKFSVIKFLQDSILSNKAASIFTSWDNKITLKKQTA
jgi:hypothetical protein